MKLTAIILFSACLTAGAKGYSQKITLSENNARLEKVFNLISRQSGYGFLYTTTMMEHSKLVNVNVKDAGIMEVLTICFKDQPFSYTIIEKTVVIKPKAEIPLISTANEMPPPIDVRGRVVDENGNPVIVTVLVKGTNRGTTTNEKGEFELKRVEDAAVLVISGVNIETFEVRVDGRTNLALNAKTKIKQGEEVTVIVNTGYQTISKERSAGAYSKPNMDIVANRSSSMNILQRLDGMIPGLTVNNAPMGSTNASSPLLIRGVTTIGVPDPDFRRYTGGGTNRSPLYVVDGISIEDVSSVNPQDVADITVLKDATATSIWGSRASNGVVVIVTKKGSRNEKIKITYDAFYNHQGKPAIDYFPVLNSRQFIDTYKSIFNDPAYRSQNPWPTVSGNLSTAGVGVAPHEMFLYNQLLGRRTDTQTMTSLDSLAAIDNKSQIEGLWYQNATTMNHTLSLTGGGKSYAFYGSLAYTGVKGIRPGDEDKTYKLNLRQDFNFNKVIQAFLITDLTHTVNSAKRNIPIDGIFYPYQLFRDATGNNLAMPYLVHFSDSTRAAMEGKSRLNLNYVPLDEANLGSSKTDGMFVRITGGATVRLLKGLKFEGVYGYIKGANRRRELDDAKSYLVRNELLQFTAVPSPGAAPVYHLPATGARYSVVNLNNRNWTVRNQLSYDNAWKDRLHELTVLVGQEAQEQLTIANNNTVRGYDPLVQTVGLIDYVRLSGTGLASPVWANNFGISLLPSTPPFSETETKIRLTSYYANAAYTFDRNYTVNGSWRIDESNLFGRDKSAQNRPVWSAGVKWALTNEDFIKGHPDWLNHLAVRATYGITGNAPSPSTASSFDIMIPSTSSFVPGGQGLNLSSPANAKLTWESTETINVGIDFALFKHSRVSGSIDFYQKKTSNLIGNVETNILAGFSNVIGNMGDMINKGVEVGLNSRNIQTLNFSWSTYLVLAYNKNEITRLLTPSPITTGSQKVFANYLPGYPAFSIFAYDYAGLDAMGDPQIYLSDKSVSKATGVSRPEDILHMGTYQPVWSGGLSNTFRYKSLALAVNAVYNLGHVMRRDVNTLYAGRFAHNNVLISRYGGNVHAEFLNRWQQPGDEAVTNIPAYVASTATSARRNLGYYTSADINVISASYVKLRDITLSYDLPGALINKIKSEGISFRLQVSNVMLWKANKYGIDPEFHNPIAGQRSLPLNQGAVSLGVHMVF